MVRSQNNDQAPAAIAVGAREQSMLTPLLGDVIQTLGEATPAAASYQTLLADVEAGGVAPDRVRQLESFLEMGLHTGRFRARFGALGEEALVRLFHQTPRGSIIASAVSEVNQALTTLSGQAIEKLELTSRGPDSYALSIETDHCRLTLRLEPTGVRIHDVELAV